MSRVSLTSRLARTVVLGAAGLATAAFSSFATVPSMARSLSTFEVSAQDPYGQQDPEMIPFPQIPGEDGMPSNGRRTRPARKKGGATDKSKTKKADSTAKSKPASKKAEVAGADSGKLQFSKDIAPILVANCAGCHSGEGNGLKRGKLDLSTYESMLKGTPDHKVVFPKNPDESTLVLRIKGEIEPRMPQGANAMLSDAAIRKIERWVKEGATLDSGNDPKKPIGSYAASADQLRKAEVAKLPPSERDKKIEQVGLQRFKQANAGLKPEVVPSEHFMFFSNLPKERVQSTLKTLESQYAFLKRILGQAATDWPEKVSIYAFPARKDFIEFIRTVESRPEVDAEESTTARFNVPQPFLAVVDSQGGRKEEPGAGKRKTRPRRGEDRSAEASADRTLPGLLTEALGSSAVVAAGRPPRWLASGIGTYMASKVEPKSVYYRQLRQTAFANFQQGWPTRANEALGGSDQITPDGLRAMSFALVEAMMSSEMSQRFPRFVSGMLEGGEKLDDMFQTVYRGSREEFINTTGEWVAQRYGQHP